MSTRLERLGQRIRSDVSRWRVPPGRPQIIHSRPRGFDLLVRADEDVGRAIHFAGAFEEPEADFLERSIAPTAVCVDIGANIGFFTIIMARVATHGEVHAFEPLPLNVALLSASVALNRLDNVRVNASAVGTMIGEVEFAEAADSAYSSMLDTGRKAVERRFRVPITTLDAYLGGRAIDVLKVDVEGAEGLVLAGGAQTFADPARRPTILMIELDQQNLDAFGARVPDLVAQLVDHGYAPHVLDRDSGELVDYDPATARQYNLIFTAPRGAARD